MKEIDRYKFYVEWSPETRQFVGRCRDLPGLTAIAKKPNDAREGIRAVVREVLQDLVDRGDALPVPLADLPGKPPKRKLWR